MNIKLDKNSLDNSGLYVIIAFSMKQFFGKCVGRCGKYVQPISAIQYVSNYNYISIDFLIID